MDGPALLHSWRGERTLRAVGDQLGCDPSYVSYLERGQRTPPLELAIKLRDIAGIPVDAWVESATPSAEPRDASDDTAPDARGAAEHEAHLVGLIGRLRGGGR